MRNSESKKKKLCSVKTIQDVFSKKKKYKMTNDECIATDHSIYCWRKHHRMQVAVLRVMVEFIVILPRGRKHHTESEFTVWVEKPSEKIFVF
jgi:hypothetical protein